MKGESLLSLRSVSFFRSPFTNPDLTEASMSNRPSVGKSAVIMHTYTHTHTHTDWFLTQLQGGLRCVHIDPVQPATSVTSVTTLSPGLTAPDTHTHTCTPHPHSHSHTHT